MLSGTQDFPFYGRLFVNLYQENPVNLVQAMKKGKKLDQQRASYFGLDKSDSSANAAQLIEREYQS